MTLKIILKESERAVAMGNIPAHISSHEGLDDHEADKEAKNFNFLT